MANPGRPDQMDIFVLVWHPINRWHNLGCGQDIGDLLNGAGTLIIGIGEETGEADIYAIFKFNWSVHLASRHIRSILISRKGWYWENCKPTGPDGSGIRSRREASAIQKLTAFVMVPPDQSANLPRPDSSSAPQLAWIRQATVSCYNIAFTVPPLVISEQ